MRRIIIFLFLPLLPRVRRVRLHEGGRRRARSRSTKNKNRHSPLKSPRISRDLRPRADAVTHTYIVRVVYFGARRRALNALAKRATRALVSENNNARARA